LYHEKKIAKIYDGYYIDDELYLIFPYQRHTKFTDYFLKMTVLDIKKYMFNLLSCLESIHNVGIVHRDVKPDNFLYDIETHECMLIDFGLSEVDLNETNKFQDDENFKKIFDLQKCMSIQHRIGTRGFLAPEIIFCGKFQEKAVDIWAAGIIFLSFICKRMPVLNLNKFSKLKDETIRDIQPLIIIYGRDKIKEIAEKNGCEILIPDCFNKFSFKDDFASMVERDDIKEVKFLFILGRS
jgi:cell division control protein 7